MIVHVLKNSAHFLKPDVLRLLPIFVAIKKEKRNMKKNSIRAAALACCFFMLGCRQAPMQSQSSEYDVLTVATTDRTIPVDYSATIRGRQDIAIYAQVSGKIAQVCINEGQRVRSGQTLFIIDQVPYKAALQTAEANVAAAKASVATAQLTYDSKKELFARKVVSQFDLSTAENNLLTAKAQFAQAEAQRVNAANNLSYTVVTSPSDGIVGTLPLFAILGIKDWIESLSSNLYVVGGALIVTGCLLFASDRVRKGRKNEHSARMTDALIVGAAQALATCPGLSRSGTTISVGCFLGFERKFAVRYSFIMSIPAVLGANILSLKDALGGEVIWKDVPVYLLGVLVAAVVGYACIRLLKMIAAKGKFGAFAYYCWAVGLLTVILTLVGA